MIPVIQLAQSLRFAMKDMQAAKISDFEIVEIINQAASLLYTHMGEQHVQYSMKKKALIVDASGSATLPVDFLKVHQVGMGNDGNDGIAVPSSYLATVPGTYRIVGDTFYAPEGVYGLEYYYVPARVKTFADNLDVPTAMSSYIEQIVLALYGNNLDKALAVVKDCTQSLAAREVSHFGNIGPAQVLGGRI